MKILLSAAAVFALLLALAAVAMPANAQLRGQCKCAWVGNTWVCSDDLTGQGC